LGHNFLNRALQSPKDIGQPNLADFVQVLYEVFSSLSYKGFFFTLKKKITILKNSLQGYTLKFKSKQTLKNQYNTRKHKQHNAT
jgi:hypothetical protein